ncbi:DUF4839 domain-containing protein [Rathayibacter sp. PhB152]|uniref:DUF4839 domain-containing protein n=1 Tax=Rathayibacter sp. PhB152 TaxID=2485190 RepID=UPI0011CD573E|nr:DUF4839 domain-containing protein [Rathayibacter sp. PhB152]
MAGKSVAASVAVALLLTLTACGAASPDSAIDGNASMPASSDEIKGEQYEDVAETLRDAGFTRIEAAPLGDLVTGWLKSPGEIEEVTVGDKSSFREGDAFPTSAQIVISYHSFDDKTKSSDNSTPEASSSREDVLTVENSEDFAALVSGPVSGSSVREFVEKYSGASIQLDGHITFLIDSERAVYSTATIVAGDVDGLETGPRFKITPILLPEDSPLQQKDLTEGQSIRLTASVGYFYTFEESSTFVPERDSRVVLSVEMGSLELRN